MKQHNEELNKIIAIWDEDRGWVLSCENCGNTLWEIKENEKEKLPYECPNCYQELKEIIRC